MDMMDTDYPTKNEILILGCVYLFLFAVLFVVQSFSLNCDICVLLSLVVFFLWIAVRYTSYVVKYFNILFLELTNLLGVFVIERSNFYLPEIGQFCSPHNSFFLIACTHFVFFYSLLVFDRVIEFRHSRDPEFFSLDSLIDRELLLFLANLCILGVLLISFLRIINKPAFIFGFDRFKYAEYYLQGIWSKSSSIVMLLAPFIGFAFIYGLKKVSLLNLGLFCAYLFWTGNKFGGFINIAYIMLLMLAFEKPHERRVYRKLVAVVGLIIIMGVTVVFIHNNLTYSNKNNKEYLLQRIAQQGQLWWALYVEKGVHENHISEIQDEMDTWFELDDTNVEEFNHGIYKVMRHVTPTTTFAQKILRNSRYAAATYASIYYYFNPPVLFLFAVLSSLVLCVITQGFICKFSEGGIISSVVLARILFIMHTVLTQADFQILFSWKTIIAIVIIAMCNLFPCIIRNKGKGRFNYENTCSHTGQSRV